MKWLYDVVLGKRSLQLNSSFTLWTVAMIRELVAKRFRVRLSHIGVSLAEQDGMNAQHLLWRACHQEPRSGKSLEGKEYPKLHKRAQHLGAQMFFGDKAVGVLISTAGPLGGVVSYITCQRTCLSSIQVNSWINLNNTALRHKSNTSCEELRELTISYHLRRMQKFPALIMSLFRIPTTWYASS